MFPFQEIRGLWKHDTQNEIRLIPIDWWADHDDTLAFHTPAVLGRSSHADVRLADPWVSRNHCEFYERDGHLMIRDLESRHGVYVNEDRVAQAMLHSGDVILLGVSRFRVDVRPADPNSIPETEKEQS